MIKKLITIVLGVSMVTVMLAPRNAEAILGLGDIVFDVPHTTVNAAGWVTYVIKWVAEHIAKIALASLKKQTLDYLVSKTVAWVQGDGTGGSLYPKDFGDFLEEATDQALGDVAREVGAGDLCDGFSANIRAELQLNLQPKKVKQSRTFSCSLSDVVGNIENFRDDFRNGSFIGYETLLKPENNKYGQMLIALDLAARKTDQNVEGAEQSYVAAGGFLSNKICLEWEEMLPPGAAGPLRKVKEGDPGYNKQKTPDGKPYNGSTDRPKDSQFRCVNSQVLTPGKIVGDTVAKAIGSDIDFIINAEDLSAYTAAITDALVYRLTTEIDKGLAGIKKNNQPDLSSVDSTAKKYNDQYGVVPLRQEQLNQSRNALRKMPEQLKNIVANFAEAKDTNEKLVSTLTELIACEKDKREQQAIIDTSQKTLDEALRLNVLSKDWAENPTTPQDYLKLTVLLDGLVPGIVKEVTRIAGLGANALEAGDVNFNVTWNVPNERDQIWHRYTGSNVITSIDQVGALATAILSDVSSFISLSQSTAKEIGDRLKVTEQRLDSCAPKVAR